MPFSRSACVHIGYDFTLAWRLTPGAVLRSHCIAASLSADSSSEASPSSGHCHPATVCLATPSSHKWTGGGPFTSFSGDWRRVDILVAFADRSHSCTSFATTNPLSAPILNAHTLLKARGQIVSPVTSRGLAADAVKANRTASTDAPSARKARRETLEYAQDHLREHELATASVLSSDEAQPYI